MVGLRERAPPTWNDEEASPPAASRMTTLRGWCTSGQCAHAVDGGIGEWLLRQCCKMRLVACSSWLTTANNGNVESARNLVLRPSASPSSLACHSSP